MVYLGHLLQFKETVEPSTLTLTHWFDWSAKLKFWALNFASKEVLCKPKDQDNIKLLLFCQYWGHFHISEKLGASVGRVFSAVWGEMLSGLYHCDQSPLGTQLHVETQPLRATFGPKIDSPKAVINIRRGTVSSITAKS